MGEKQSLLVPYFKSLIKYCRTRKEINFYYTKLAFPSDGKSNVELKMRVDNLKTKLDDHIKKIFNIQFKINPTDTELVNFIESNFKFSEELHNEVLEVAKEIIELRFELNLAKLNKIDSKK